jgi:hypothetical protein
MPVLRMLAQEPHYKVPHLTLCHICGDACPPTRALMASATPTT